jgi:cell shape-determining protein MreD
MFVFSIALSTVMFVAGAIMGYIMFSESIESQFTLNLPPNLMASKIAVWITVIVLFWTLDRKENYGL